MSFFWRHRGQKKWLVMKLTVLFIFVFSFTLVANTSAQQERVNLNLKNVSIRTLFGEIQKQTALSFVYNMELTQHLGQVSVKAKQEAVESVLNRVLANTGLSYKFEGDIIVICVSIPTQPVQSEQKKEIVIEGKVVDKDSMAIIGATVLVKGTTLGTATDLDGNFKLTVQITHCSDTCSFHLYRSADNRLFVVRIYHFTRNHLRINRYNKHNHEQ